MIWRDINKLIEKQMILNAARGTEPAVAGQYEEEADFSKLNTIAKAASLAAELVGQEQVCKPGVTLSEIQKELSGIPAKEEPKTEIKKAEPKEDIKKTLDSVIQTIDLKDSLNIEFDYECWAKIKAWVSMTTEEISGMGLVKRTNKGFHVYDVFLIKQTNTGSDTDIDDMALIQLYEELMNKDDEDNGTRADDFKFWWHSHANMSVFWSGTDENCIKEKLVHAPWWLSAVFNRKEEVRTRLDIKTPHMRLDNLKCTQNSTVPKHIEEFCKKEYKDKVEEKKLKIYTYNNTNQFGSYYNYYDRTQPGTCHKKFNNTTNLTQLAQHQRHIPGLPPTKKTIVETSLNTLIPVPNTIRYVQANLTRAIELYSESHKKAMEYAEDTASLLSQDTCLVPGGRLFYFRKPNTTTTGHVRCLAAGSIKIGQYISVASEKKNGTAYMGKVDAIFAGKTMTYTKSASFGDNRFAELVLRLDPPMEWMEEDDEKIEQSSGVILSNSMKIPESFLGEQSQFFEIEEEIEETEDTENINDTFDSLTEGAFAYAITHIKDRNPSLYDRMEKWVNTIDKNGLIRILDDVESSIEIENQVIAASIVFKEQIDREELEDMCLELCLDYPSEMFPIIWNQMPVEYYCTRCYEPLKSLEEECEICES